jgi:phosphoribosylformimino-5-aminoimidazole carboxamide ribotide isomerase
MMILPAIDLRAGSCVRLIQGRKDSAKVYDGDPVDFALYFQSCGAQMLHVVDLDGAFSESKSLNRRALREIARAVEIPIQFGGGIRTRKDATEVLDLGVSRIVIGTMAIESPTVLAKMLCQFAAEQFAIGIDARNGEVATRGWKTQERVKPLELARKFKELGAERVVYTDIERDGTLSGPNIDQTCAIAEVGLKVTASGGISSIQDLRNLKAKDKCGIDSVIIGKALYERRFTLEAALDAVA